MPRDNNNRGNQSGDNSRLVGGNDEKKLILHHLINFQNYLNQLGYISSYDWDFKKEANNYLDELPN